MKRSSSSARYATPVAAGLGLLFLAAAYYYYSVYHPAERVLDAYVVADAGRERINFIDYYKLSFNVGTTRTPLYLESYNHRFHSLDAKTGLPLAKVEVSDSLYLGRSARAVWFLKGHNVIMLHPRTGSECGRQAVPAGTLHTVEYWLGTDSARITLVDGQTLLVPRGSGCSDEALPVIYATKSHDVSFIGTGPRKKVARGGKASDADFLAPEILTTRYFASRNAVNTKDVWNRLQVEITAPLWEPGGLLLVKHKKALNQSDEIITAFSPEAQVVWTAPAHLRGSYVVPDITGITIITDTSPLIMRQTAVHINRSGSVDWSYAY